MYLNPQKTCPIFILPFNTLPHPYENYHKGCLWYTIHNHSWIHSLHRFLSLDVRKMLLSPLSQPVVRALYNGANNRAARDTPHLHCMLLDIYTLMTRVSISYPYLSFFSRTKYRDRNMYVAYTILHLFYTSFLLLHKSRSFARSQIWLFLNPGGGGGEGVVQVKIFYSFTGLARSQIWLFLTKIYCTLTYFLPGRYYFLNSQRNCGLLHKKVRGISQQFPKKLRWASQAKIQGPISQQFTTKNERNSQQ